MPAPTAAAPAAAPASGPAAERELVALLLPTGRDAPVARSVLQRFDFAPLVCADIAALGRAIDDGAGALVVAEEALDGRARAALLDRLAAEPSWSSVPIVVLTGHGELSRAIPSGLQLLAARANVTLLERPVRVATLVTALRSAVRARRRQLEVRDYLEERRAAERTLRESESRLRDAVLSVPYPMMLHAEDGEVLQLSNAWTTLTGYDAAALRTTDDWVRCALEDGAAAEAALHEGLAPGRADGTARHVGEWVVRTASGERRVWDVHAVTLARLPDGRRLQLTAAVDVTAYRELLIREREAREQAETANRAKSDFLAVMSHELRTPLNAIAGYAQLIALGLRGPVTDAQRADLDRIDRSQRHLLSLINDILNFAKIEAGHVAFDIQPVAIAEVLSGLEALVAPQLSAKSITFRDRSADCDADVMADAEKTRQIVLNLLSNAVKFTSGGGTITLECVADEHTVNVTVTDDGIGIAPEKLALIFEPFVQVDRHSASGLGGTGLGLSISRDLARRMAGDLTVVSSPACGAAFTLSLPRAVAG